MEHSCQSVPDRVSFLTGTDGACLLAAMGVTPPQEKMWAKAGGGKGACIANLWVLFIHGISIAQTAGLAYSGEDHLCTGVSRLS